MGYYPSKPGEPFYETWGDAAEVLEQVRLKFSDAIIVMDKDLHKYVEHTQPSK